MPTDQHYLNQLKQKQIEHAMTTLSCPSNKSSFGYGEASGILKGLVLAEQLFLESLGDDNDKSS